MTVPPYAEVKKAIDQALTDSGIPGLSRCGEACEHQFALDLQIDKTKHSSQPEIFIFVTAEDVTSSQAIVGGLDKIIEQKIRRTSVYDPQYSLMTTAVWQDKDKAWHATTFDGREWKYDGDFWDVASSGEDMRGSTAEAT